MSHVTRRFFLRSSGIALVITALRRGLSCDMNARFVRIIRKVSAAGDMGASKAIRGSVFSGTESIALLRFVLPDVTLGPR